MHVSKKKKNAFSTTSANRSCTEKPNKFHKTATQCFHVTRSLASSFRPGRLTKNEILERLFPNFSPFTRDLVMQGCNGDVLKAIEHFLSIAEENATEGIGLTEKKDFEMFHRHQNYLHVTREKAFTKYDNEFVKNVTEQNVVRRRLSLKHATKEHNCSNNDKGTSMTNVDLSPRNYPVSPMPLFQWETCAQNAHVDEEYSLFELEKVKKPFPDKRQLEETRCYELLTSQATVGKMMASSCSASRAANEKQAFVASPTVPQPVTQAILHSAYINENDMPLRMAFCHQEAATQFSTFFKNTPENSYRLSLPLHLLQNSRCLL